MAEPRRSLSSRAPSSIRVSMPSAEWRCFSDGCGGSRGARRACVTTAEVRSIVNSPSICIRGGGSAGQATAPGRPRRHRRRAERPTPQDAAARDTISEVRGGRRRHPFNSHAHVPSGWAANACRIRQMRSRRAVEIPAPGRLARSRHCNSPAVTASSMSTRTPRDPTTGFLAPTGVHTVMRMLPSAGARPPRTSASPLIPSGLPDRDPGRRGERNRVHWVATSRPGPPPCRSS